MNSNNPYQAPDTVNPESDINDGSIISMMETKPLKKLYYRSVNLGTIATLFIISMIALYGIYLYLLIDTKINGEGDIIIISMSNTGASNSVSAFLIITAIGLFLRHTWGRIVGIIACILMLATLQIITIILGIVGLVALFKAPELFGPDRILHKDLKREFKLRKRRKRL